MNSTDPRLLLSLWVYAYSKGIGSAREIERQCEHDPAFQWLTGMEGVNYHTLSSFRSENQGALDELFVQVLGVLSGEGLIRLERVTQDGTKVKAYASPASFRREDRLREHLQAAREQVEHLSELGEAEREGVRRVKAQARAARERKERLALALQELETIRANKSRRSEHEARASETDPEARVMRQADGGYAPSYNLQLSTDSAAGIIVGTAVSQTRTDFEHLAPAVQRIEAHLGRLPGQMIADSGYTTKENILALQDQGVDFIGVMGLGTANPANRYKVAGIDPGYFAEAFTYDQDSDSYRCPAGKRLRLFSRTTKKGCSQYRYRARADDCGACAFKPLCCPKTAHGRSVTRSEDDPVVTAFKQRMQEPAVKEIYKRRSRLAEFPNAWIKEKIGLGRFRLRGLTKVRMETLRAVITYNIAQWVRLRWRPQWRTAVI